MWKVFGNVNAAFFEELTGIDADSVGVQFCGVVDAARLVEELRDAAIYVHPSYVENSPNSVCEAQMMGVPVIAADTGGVYSLIEDEVDGLLAYTGEEADFVEAIKLLWVDRGFAREIADAGRRRALKRHDRKAVVDGLLDIYKDVIRHYKMRLDLGTE